MFWFLALGFFFFIFVFHFVLQFFFFHCFFFICLFYFFFFSLIYLCSWFFPFLLFSFLLSFYQTTDISIQYAPHIQCIYLAIHKVRTTRTKFEHPHFSSSGIILKNRLWQLSIWHCTWKTHCGRGMRYQKQRLKDNELIDSSEMNRLSQRWGNRWVWAEPT